MSRHSGSGSWLVLISRCGQLTCWRMLACVARKAFVREFGLVNFVYLLSSSILVGGGVPKRKWLMWGQRVRAG